MEARDITWPPPEGPWLIWADCVPTMHRFPDGVFDLVFADPPYNLSKPKGLAWAFSSHVSPSESWDMFSAMDFEIFNERWLTEAWRVLRPGGALVVCGSYHSIFGVGSIVQRLPDAKVLNDIIWWKPNAQPNITCRSFKQSTETLLWVAKGKKWTFNYREMKEENEGKQMPNVWRIPVTPAREKVAGRRHPTQKPLALVRRVLRAATRPGDLVLDPFMGTGTTAVACAEMGRRFVGCEVEPSWQPLVAERLASVQRGT